MFQYIYHIIFILLNPQYFRNIEQKNVLKTEFNKEFNSHHYFDAIKTFERIEKLTTLIEPELRLDAAHAYYKLQDSTKARMHYEQAILNPNEAQMAVALNQLGNLAVQQGDTAKGLEYLRQSLEKNNDNKISRYNYELIKSIYKPKFSPPPPPNQNKTSNEVEASDKKEEELDAYKPKNISKERALQLLDDLKNSEMKITTNDKNTARKIEKDW